MGPAGQLLLIMVRLIVKALGSGVLTQDGAAALAGGLGYKIRSVLKEDIKNVLPLPPLRRGARNWTRSETAPRNIHKFSQISCMVDINNPDEISIQRLMSEAYLLKTNRHTN